MSVGLLDHLKVSRRGVITPYVLLPGDPGRVDDMGKHLKRPEVRQFNREFKLLTGLYRGIPITICSTGIGCPSTAIATEELIDGGAQVLIRVGTCGGAWRENIPNGSLVIATASIRDEGTTHEYIPEGFPAVADFTVVSAIAKAATERNIPYFIGINRTHDAFYGSQDAITKWGRYLLDERWRERGVDTPILSSEMESAALFVIASLCNVKAGAVFAVNAEPESLKQRLLGKCQKVVAETNGNTTHQISESATLVALEAIVRISKNS